MIVWWAAFLCSLLMYAKADAKMDSPVQFHDNQLEVWNSFEFYMDQNRYSWFEEVAMSGKIQDIADLIRLFHFDIRKIQGHVDLCGIV
ncbi:unnamed protein product [Onchocerca ochengi]|uniref:Cathepsin B n=1 Tax=Onchocerca ochengi TaxID=42157 RepID=A0A182EUX6_ONCOC|nr:unnamed protein product [Onchocerca ochengi]